MRYPYPLYQSGPSNVPETGFKLSHFLNQVDIMAQVRMLPMRIYFDLRYICLTVSRRLVIWPIEPNTEPGLG